MSEQQQNLPIKLPKEKGGRAPTLYFIVAIKLLKGVAALLLALGAYSLTDNNLPEDFRKLLEFLHLDPEKKFFLEIADRLSDVTTSNLNSITAICVAYGLFMLVQAVGLAFRAKWAVWLIIVESGFLIPIEVRELIRRPPPEVIHHPHLPKIGAFIILAINVAIVWYLYWNRERIIRHHRH
jgi:uncharacterized membrane protein (DUF2068 family)